jgi:hypothetical protein
MAATCQPRREYSTTEFTYKDGVFSAFVSDLPRFDPEQVYPDALDEGICLVSHRTGRKAWFVLSQAHTDREGDLTHWTFVPSTEALRVDRRLANVRVEVFND